MSSICLVVAFWCAVLLSHPAAAEERHEYDPATCKSDAQGKLYIALGHYVLATPYSKKSGVYMRDPLRPGNIGLVAPDPTEPVGCPDNPLQSWSYEFIYALPAIGAGTGSDNPQADRLTLYRTSDSPSPRPDDPEWAGADLLLMEWNSSCKLAAVREELPSGLTACLIRVKEPDTRKENWGGAYRAHADVYTTPLGKPFIVECGPMLFENAISHCTVAYTMMPGLGVGYWFQPYLGPHHIAIDSVIEYNRGLRTAIEGMVIKDYAWKGEAPVGATAK